MTSSYSKFEHLDFDKLSQASLLFIKDIFTFKIWTLVLKFLVLFRPQRHHYIQNCVDLTNLWNFYYCVWNVHHVFELLGIEGWVAKGTRMNECPGMSGKAMKFLHCQSLLVCGPRFPLPFFLLFTTLKMREENNIIQ